MGTSKNDPGKGKPGIVCKKCLSVNQSVLKQLSWKAGTGQQLETWLPFPSSAYKENGPWEKSCKLAYTTHIISTVADYVC